MLELINSGATDLPPDDVQLRRGMMSIIQSFQIDINLPVTSDNIPMTTQKLTDSSYQHENMDDLTDKINVSSQDMAEQCDKTQMMTETPDETKLPKPYK